VGVNGQLQRGLGAACGVGHQLLHQLFDIGKNGVEAQRGHGLSGQLPLPWLRRGDRRPAARCSGALPTSPGTRRRASPPSTDGGQVGQSSIAPAGTGCWTWRGWPQSSRTQQPGLPVSSVASRAAFSVPVSGTTGIGVLATASSPSRRGTVAFSSGPRSRRAGGSGQDHARRQSRQTSELSQSGSSPPAASRGLPGRATGLPPKEPWTRLRNQDAIVAGDPLPNRERLRARPRELQGHHGRATKDLTLGWRGLLCEEPGDEASSSGSCLVIRDAAAARPVRDVRSRAAAAGGCAGVTSPAGGGRRSARPGDQPVAAAAPQPQAHRRPRPPAGQDGDVGRDPAAGVELLEP
jgi:hypothetical protein